MNPESEPPTARFGFGGPVVLALLATAALALVTNFITEPGRWYSSSIPLRWQTDAFLHGNLALDLSPQDMQWDMVWDNGAVQQVWGLGVPAFRLLFELPAVALGFSGFPDRITFLIAYLLCAFYLCRTLAARGGAVSDAGLWRPLRLFSVAALLLFAPPFVNLVATRFQVYEEVVAYGYLYAIFLFAALLGASARPTFGRLLALAALAGLAAFIRPTLAFYGMMTFLLALLIAWRARMRWQGLATMTLAFGAGVLLLCYTNWHRFGAIGEFGHRLNITNLNHNTFSLKFDYPFRQEPVLSAAQDTLASLFFVRELNGFDFYRADFIPGQSPTYRWHEMYFTGMNPLYLVLFLGGVTFWVLNRRRVRELWGVLGRGQSNVDASLAVLALPWAVGVVVPMFALYLWSPSMASRYAVDFLPAIMVGIAGLVWNLFEFKRAFKKTWMMDLVAVALYCATAGWLVFEIARAEISPSHRKGASLTAESIRARIPEPAGAHSIDSLHRYGRGMTNEIPRLPYNGTGWNLETGKIQPSVLLFASDPECVELVLSQDEPFSPEDLAPIRAKVGLEELAVESVEIDGHSARVIFAAPRRTRYQRGLQVCFLGFIPAEDLGQSEPGFRLVSVSFARGGDDRTMGPWDHRTIDLSGADRNVRLTYAVWARGFLPRVTERVFSVVAQVSNLLYRRFPIGRNQNSSRIVGDVEAPQAGSTAIHQVGNLRYVKARVLPQIFYC